MRFLNKSLFVLLVGLVLTSCGGGGGGGNDSGFNPPGLRVSVTAASGTTTPFSLVGVSVTVRGDNNQAVPDGTVVRLQVSPVGVGLVSTQQIGATGGAVTTVIGDAVSAPTSGGIANFRFHSRAVGTATLTASAASGGSATQSGSANITVGAGPGTDPRLTLQIQSTTIPLAPPGVASIFIGSPYISLVSLTQRRLDGTLVNGSATGGGNGDIHCNGGSGAAAAIGAGLNSMAIFLPAEGVDDDGTIFVCRSVTLGVNSGRHDFYVVSLATQGTAELSVTAQDPDTGETLSVLQVFNITNGAPQLPGSIIITSDTQPVYISTVNGAHAKQLEVNVFDGGGTFVPNPAVGVNNVRLEIVNGGVGGERVRGVNATGGVVQGDSISLRSANGIANATFEAGTTARVVTLRATTDRADNNIDNGITDPVTSTRQFTVSDGRIFDVDITKPANQAASAAVTGPVAGSDTYRMNVEALVTDRAGVIVPAGQEIRFGLIDEPQSNGAFVNAGPNGDPQEGGTLFTSPTGAFTTAGGGAGPNDTLIVFGEESSPNRDLESARSIASIQSATQLTVTQRFNFNDDTGTSVNNGPVLPYIIGHATDANISAVGVTDGFGVARAVITYPRSKLGKRMVVWAQGSGDFVNGSPELVTDAEILRMQGAGPLTLTSPTSILANRTSTALVCVRDISGAGIQGIAINYLLTGISNFTVDGSNAAAGTLASVTGVDGCTIATIVTQGVVQTGVAGNITFSVDAVSSRTDIIGPTSLNLSATPGVATVSAGVSGGLLFQLLLQDGSGAGISGVNIAATCTVASPASLVPGAIPPTGAGGITSAVVNYSGFLVGTSGTCTFTTTVGGATATVRIQQGSCPIPAPSPPPPGC